MKMVQVNRIIQEELRTPTDWGKLILFHPYMSRRTQLFTYIQLQSCYWLLPVRFTKPLYLPGYRGPG